MRDFTKLTAKQFLSTVFPERLFSQDLSEAKKEYHDLAKIWHPDHSKDPQATEVFQHINKLHQYAQEKQNMGIWDEPAEKIDQETPGIKKFQTVAGSFESIPYIVEREFELGRYYIGSNTVAYEVDRDYEDLYRTAYNRIKKLKFEDLEMKAEMMKNLPVIERGFSTKNSHVMVIRKTPDQILLADLMRHWGEHVIPIPAIGWILNLLYNLSCYFQYAGITHNAIGPDTFFISTLKHTGMLLGGWWYSAEQGKKIEALPERSLIHIPRTIVSNKKADFKADLELIRSVGRELLGDAGGSVLRFDKRFPKPVTDWLLLPSSGKATEDYKQWKRTVLPAAFGPPKFILAEVKESEVYKDLVSSKSL